MLRRRRKTRRGKRGDPSDISDGVSAGVNSAIDVIKFSKDPSIKSGGAALSSIGAAAMFAPPPAGPAIGGILMLTGGLMTLFSPHEPSIVE